MRCLFWASESLDQFPHVKSYVARIEELGFVQEALKVPEQDLVSRIRADPDLERQIMERMKKAREVKERERHSDMGEKVDGEGKE